MKKNYTGLFLSTALVLGGITMMGCEKKEDTTPPEVKDAQSSADHQSAKDSASSAADSMKDAASKTGDAIKSETAAAKEKMGATTMPSMATPTTMP